MPLMNYVTSNAPANMRGRVDNATPVPQGGAASSQGGDAQYAPVKAGPAVVVKISDAARFLSLGVSNPAINDLSKPGINNGTMAAEGGAAAELRGRLTERYEVEVARLSKPLGT